MSGRSTNEKEDLMKRPPTYFEAISPLVVLMCLLAIGYGLLHFKPEPLLVISTIYAALMARRVGLSWAEMQNGIVEKINVAMPALIILIVVGGLIGTWIYSGTIPMMIYFGLKCISAQYIILAAFVVTIIVSMVTGTSWGSVGTVGVAMIGVAMGLGASLPATAGAIVAGSYMGDKLSPLSDTTNLSSMVAGADLYEHIRHMLYTTVPAGIISFIVYLVVGMNSSGEAATPQTLINMLSTMDSIFNWNVLLLLPLVIVLFGSYKKYPTTPVMIISCALAILLGWLYQGFELKSGMAAFLSGFNVNMVHTEGFNADNVIWEVTRLINRGGMRSMMNTILLILCAMGFAGIVSKMGALDVILECILSRVKTTGGLILSTCLSCITMAIVTGSVHLTVLIPGDIFKSSYRKKGLAAKNLSRTLEDSGTVVVPIVPWSSSGAYMAATLGVAVMDFFPWAILCYTSCIFAVIWGYTGFFIAKEEPEETPSFQENKRSE